MKISSSRKNVHILLTLRNSFPNCVNLFSVTPSILSISSLLVGMMRESATMVEDCKMYSGFEKPYISANPFL